MRPDVTGPSADRLRELCGQFEELLVAAIVPRSLFTHDALGQSDASPSLSSGVTEEVFRQTLAAAIERGGGLGLAGELARLLPSDAT